MSAPSVISGLHEIADQYDAILCDVWGVIHNGRESFPQACEALIRLRRAHGPVVLISNVPRPSRFVLSPAGASSACPRRLVRLRDLGRRHPRRTGQARARPGLGGRAGPRRRALRGLGRGPDRNPEHAAFISCTGLFDDETETPEDYRERLAGCAARELEMICANPDRVVQRGDKLI